MSIFFRFLSLEIKSGEETANKKALRVFLEEQREAGKYVLILQSYTSLA